MKRGAGRLWGGTRGSLRQLLAEAHDMDVAAEMVVDHLFSAGIPMPSVYLEQSGRLRCLAFRGYWQVIDGIPPGVGIAGRCFLEGQAVVLQDVSASERFLASVPEITAEVCVPIVLDEQVIGIVNGESSVPLPEDALALLEDAAAAFAQRVGELGLPAESAYQRLAWYTARLAELTTEGEIEQLALRAAGELSSMATGLIARRSASGLAVTAAAGPLADALRLVTGENLVTIAGWVEAGMSCWTRGDGAVQGFPAHQALHDAGVAAFVVLPLIARGERIGFLLCAATRRVRPAADMLGQLELLVAQAASSLQTSRAIAELRERASQDALTGLGHHAAFHTVLSAPALDEDRAAVLLIDIDNFKEINDSRGHLTGDAVLVEIATALAGGLRDQDRLFRIGGDEFASILQVTTPEEAVEVAERLRTAARATGWCTVSIGVAWGRPGKDLVARADNALYTAKGGGRNQVRLAPPTG